MSIAPADRPADMADGWYVADAPLPEHPLERLAYYARLAPSTHNSQPWRFVIGDGEIDLFADADSWLCVSDADRRELFISLGCALESLCIAADYAGYGSQTRYFPVPGNETFVAKLELRMHGSKRESAASGLLRYMPSRHTSHRIFDAQRPVSEQHRLALYNSFQIGEVSLQYLHDRPVLDGLGQLESRADTMLMANPDYRRELGRWIGRGVFGTPWLLAKLGQFAMTQLPVGGAAAARITHVDTERLASAPLVALLTTHGDRRVDQIQAGQAYMRMALLAESLDIRVQPMSQVLECPNTRRELSLLAGLGERTPQHVFRLGHAERENERTPRLPLARLIIERG